MADTGKLKVTTPSDREVLFMRAFDAPRRLVFDAHTKPELIKRWLLGPPGWTMPVCEVDLRVGGKYRYEWAHPEHASFGTGGVYREIAAPERLVSTERPDWTDGEALCTMVLTGQGGKTTMKLTMFFSSKEARDSALATGMAGGMEASYQGLDELLASTPAQGENSGP